MEDNEQEALFQQCVQVTTEVFTNAQGCVMFRASIAYLLQHIKSFLNGMQNLKKSGDNKISQRVLGRYCLTMNQVNDLIALTGPKWKEILITKKCSQVMDDIEKIRKLLNEMCGMLEFDTETIIGYNENQNLANKISDLSFYKDQLLDMRSNSLSATNAVDIMQLIEERLYSIRQDLPKKRRHTTVPKDTPSSPIESTSITDKLEEALDQFKDINITPDDMKIETKIGNGGFGTVFLGTRYSTGEYMAVKEIKPDKITTGGLSSLFSEIMVMSKLKHRHVIELTGIYNRRPYQIITRFCPGQSLFDRLHRPQGKPLTTMQKTRLAYQMAKGLEHLHSQGVVHRDLKTLNILLDNHDAAIIADFGLCGVITPKSKELTGSVGTPNYTAPEVLGHKKYNELVDVYSYGVILWEMATNLIPFREKTQAEIIDHVVHRGLRLKIPKNITDGLRRLIVNCWAANPSERPQFKEIVKLFETGMITFNDKEPITNPQMLKAESDEPPLNLKYISSVLHNPSNKNLCSVVDFITKDMSNETRDFLIGEEILDSYDSDSEHPERRLLLASHLLSDDMYDKYVDKAIETIKTLNEEQLCYAIKFILKVPERLLSKFDFFIEESIKSFNSNDQESGFLAIRLLSKFGTETTKKYHTEISEFLNKSSIENIRSQETVNAIVQIVPVILEDLKDSSLFISLLSGIFVIPAEFQTFIVDRVGAEHIQILFRAFLKSPRTHSVIAKILTMMKKSDIDKIVEDQTVFDDLEHLLNMECAQDSALMMFYVLSTSPNVPHMISKHPILNDILQMKGHELQRLMIFSALFQSEEFTKETPLITEGALKLLINALNDLNYANCALRVIGSLSTHKTGNAVISDFGILPIYVQYFLSPNCTDLSLCMTILINMAKFSIKVPQASLIVSCLMQDLVDSMNSKPTVLQTMIAIARSSPEAFQASDLQHNILPFISPKEDPLIVLYVLDLFNAIDLSVVKSFSRILVYCLLDTISQPEMQYPEILAQSITIINTLSSLYDVKDMLKDSSVLEFFKSAGGQMINFSDLHSKIESNVKYLSLYLSS
ncbi:TKL family protein kinase [Trichomonas vaginalis G3]|uniref:TKL family protein kinase n=1 Tax=Trichomonas vaginalis (strain ATCC PRA-98 / G3) TaxID=412133 RepID=A2FG05_TRIV3|nr:protein kinase protein [Trichomonas vaginalis G3]EAX96167.1 TKL family protein kinase [Trichomonas vaginalis G3]KAI5495104.1 protein kinase protein [Trichomonas vaginalis G3]|eukprot:XP_001309097.1 TKL family protein kinase [Trichomonas vaginalis G3]